MRLLVAKAPLRRLLRWIRRGLFAIGITLLAYCGFVLVEAWSFQHAERRQLQRLTSSQTAPPAVSDGLIGRIDIPRLGLSVMVVEGTSEVTLRRAAGHIAGTALPGQPGNVGISAHRDTFFRPLRNIRRDDMITLTTLQGEYRYRVVSTRIVRPTNVGVLDPGGTEVLTLVTCYPFYFVGPAPSRFIVRAERVT